jgi:hypothetical protein
MRLSAAGRKLWPVKDKPRTGQRAYAASKLPKFFQFVSSFCGAVERHAFRCFVSFLTNRAGA